MILNFQKKKKKKTRPHVFLCLAAKIMNIADLHADIREGNEGVCETETKCVGREGGRLA